MAGERVNTVVIGGGIVGAAVAYNLAEQGQSGVVLVEAEELGSGSTGGSFGGVRQQFSTPLEIELSRRGLEFWRTAAERFDWPVPWHENGYLFMSGRPQIFQKLQEAAELQRSLGMTEVEVVSAERIPEIVPWVDPQGLLGGTYTPRDGKTTPTDGVVALARAARRLGVRVMERWPVRQMTRDGQRWRVEGPEVLQAERVVACVGYWASDFMRPFGLELTVRPLPLYSAITEPVLAGQRVPLTLDMDTGFVLEREGEALLIAILLEDNPPGYGHAQMLDEFAELARVRAPALAEVGIARHVVANVDLGGDGHPYVGEVEPGLWMAAGFGGHGAMHGPPVAELLVRQMLGRPDPSVDISSLNPWRQAGLESEWMVASKKG